MRNGRRDYVRKLSGIAAPKSYGLANRHVIMGRWSDKTCARCGARGEALKEPCPDEEVTTR